MFWTSVSQMETEARLSGRVGAFKSVCNSLALALAAILLTAATVADRQLILAAAVVAGVLSTACAVAMLLKLRGAARA
jgi:hypothetical protein